MWLVLDAEKCPFKYWALNQASGQVELLFAFIKALGHSYQQIWWINVRITPDVDGIGASNASQETK